jgi:hypothetical protein
MKFGGDFYKLALMTPGPGGVPPQPGMTSNAPPGSPPPGMLPPPPPNGGAPIPGVDPSQQGQATGQPALNGAGGVPGGAPGGDPSLGGDPSQQGGQPPPQGPMDPQTGQPIMAPMATPPAPPLPVNPRPPVPPQMQQQQAMDPHLQQRNQMMNRMFAEKNQTELVMQSIQQGPFGAHVNLRQELWEARQDRLSKEADVQTSGTDAPGAQQAGGNAQGNAQAANRPGKGVIGLGNMPSGGNAPGMALTSGPRPTVGRQNADFGSAARIDKSLSACLWTSPRA